MIPDPCAEVTIPGLGKVCARDKGVFQLKQDAGTDLVVHGHDYFAADSGADVAEGPRKPVCAPEGSHRMIVVYARPSDGQNHYSTRLSAIRGLVEESNGLLSFDASQRGATADYRVACTANGEIAVRHEVLATKGANDSFGSVVQDLRAKGYTSTLDKVWVWYEGSVGSGIAGTGHLYWDESRSVNNRNNGGSGTAATFAVLWGAVAEYSVRTWMHENAHNLGAVQQNAPYSSGAAHCTDGLDIMCYADGGRPYNPNVCTDRMHFDCGANTYFNPDPPAGSYLATNWNLAWSGNRFIRMHPTLNWPKNPVQIDRTASEALVQVRRLGIIDIDVPVNWALQPTTADATDFVSLGGTHMIPAGQRLSTIAIPLTEDGPKIHGTSATLSLTSTRVSASIPSATVTFVDPEQMDEPLKPFPDLAIGKRLAGPFLTEGKHSPTGEGQVRGRDIRRGGKTSFVIKAANRGDAPQYFRLRVESLRGYPIAVRDANTGAAILGTNKTRQVLVRLAPGQSRALQVIVKVPKGTPRGIRNAARVQLSPKGQQVLDTAIARLRVR